MKRTLCLAIACLALPTVVVAQDQPTPAKVGAPAPDFTLTDLNGKTHRLSDYTKAKKVVVLEWFNPGCPAVKKVHNKGIPTALATKLEGQDVVWLAINSGGPGKQGHGLAANKAGAERWSIDYPILLDESGTVGRSFRAKVTPHMFVVDAGGTLVFNGALDNRKDPSAADYVSYVELAVTSALKGETVATPFARPYG